MKDELMLKQRLREARTADKGFTLIELLIVIVVLGILAGIVVFGVATFRTDAQASAACANAKTVDVASQAYIAKNGTPAASVAALQTANYLQAVPNPAVAYDAATGKVTYPAGC
jgi:prepilin-type N-terminal cleavage/methylation domain-containing protein